MTVALDTKTVKTLLSPLGASPLVKALYKAQYQKTLLSLYQLRGRLYEESPDLLRSTNFAEAYAELGNLPVVVQEAIISYPSLNFWLDVGWELIRQHVHSQSDSSRMKLHLLDFGSFVLAAKLMAGFGEYECLVKADAHGRIVLPGTGVYFESGDMVPNQQVYVCTSGGNISARSTGHFNNILRIRRRVVPMLKAGIEFNPIDTYLRLLGHSTFDYENLTLMEFIRWVNLLNDAWEWVEEQDTALTTEMKMILRAVVPVKRADKHIHTSGSFKEAPGLIALSWDDDVPVLAEALVHEYHHQKLNALLNLDRLIEGPTFEAVYPSPWRKDARPLLGILHGVYTFQAVLRFWIKLLATKEVGSYAPPIRERTHTLHSQLLTALATLQEYAIWSPLGEAFFEAIREAVVELGCCLPEAG